MNIVILGPVITNNYFGGVATFDEALAEAFNKLGFHTQIITSQKGKILNKELNIKQIKKSNIINTINNYGTDLTIASLQYGTLLKKIHTGKKIYFLHGFFNIQSYGFLKTMAATALTEKMVKYADYVISNSNFTAAVNQRIWNLHVDGVAHLGVDDKFLASLPAVTERTPDELKKILYVGRLAVSKHVERIIEAASLLNSCSYELVIVGDGPEKQNLQEKAQRMGVNAKFLGRIEHEKITSLYLKCGVFVSLSESEPYGLTYAEALMSGCKIVCPNTGGQVEFLMNFPDRVSFVDVLNTNSIKNGLNRSLNIGNVTVDNEMKEMFNYQKTAQAIIDLSKTK